MNGLNLSTNSFIGNLPDWLKNPLFGIDGLAPWQLIYLFIIIILALVLRTVVIYIISSQVKKVFNYLLKGKLDNAIQLASMPLGNLALNWIFSNAFRQYRAA